jgi:hypothetical protein
VSLTAGEVALILPTLLPQRATVYTDDGSGAYATAVATDLACRVLSVSAGGAATRGQRAELLATRRLVFDPDYAMPDDVQVLVDGVRYDPTEGTFRPYQAGPVVVKAVDMVVVAVES